MEIKVSIIVPIYNTEKYLGRCLDSILNQTLKDIEIICINDGSTDSSLSLLEKYAAKDNRIKIINQKNQGVSVARNNGIKQATGEYIGFVDSDDWIANNFYELLYNNAKKYSTDIACGEFVMPTNKKHKNYLKLNKIKVYNKTEDKYRVCNIPRKNYIFNKIYKRSSLINSKIEFEPNIVFEDLLWTHKVIHKLDSLVTVPNAVYFYFENTNSITHTDINYKYFYKANKDCIEFVMLNRIKVKNLKAYTPQKRIRINILGIRFFDFLLWDCVQEYRILGLPVLKIFITKHINSDNNM